VRQALWRATDAEFKATVARYQNVLTNQKTMVEEERVDDFTHETPNVYSEPDVKLAINRDDWANRARAISEMALSYPQIYQSQVSVGATVDNRYLVTSEGTRLKTGQKLLRVIVTASTKADDGMDLSQSFVFSASEEKNLPDEATIRAAF